MTDKQIESSGDVPFGTDLPSELLDRVHGAKRRGEKIKAITAEAFELWLRFRAGTLESKGLKHQTSGSQATADIVTLPGGGKLSKPLQELVPQLERIVEDKRARLALQVMVESLDRNLSSGPEVGGEDNTGTGPRRGPGRR